MRNRKREKIAKKRARVIGFLPPPPPDLYYKAVVICFSVAPPPPRRRSSVRGARDQLKWGKRRKKKFYLERVFELKTINSNVLERRTILGKDTVYRTREA